MTQPLRVLDDYSSQQITRNVRSTDRTVYGAKNWCLVLRRQNCTDYTEHSSRIRFLRFFENPKKRDFLRFFEVAFKKT